jgi:hypothetical protein
VPQTFVFTSGEPQTKGVWEPLFEMTYNFRFLKCIVHFSRSERNSLCVVTWRFHDLLIALQSYGPHFQAGAEPTSHDHIPGLHHQIHFWSVVLIFICLVWSLSNSYSNILEVICVFDRCLIWISAKTLAILTEVFHWFTQSLQAKARIVSQLGQILSSLWYPIIWHYSQ